MDKTKVPINAFMETIIKMATSFVINKELFLKPFVLKKTSKLLDLLRKYKTKIPIFTKISWKKPMTNK